ncbi:muscleblind-like protein 1 [Malurus melanocephalus]|uniref:muscleblind-like protein 1 n=1 Tax=Malurus melanocephalus TaxID=175006 RepID=UPI0025491651|nr:muscleblind-like protein 1 [Malurus melanocephalus]
MFSVTPSLATNASAAFNPYLGPVSPGLVPAEILPTAPMLVTGNPGVPVPAAAAAAAQKLMRTDRLEPFFSHLFSSLSSPSLPPILLQTPPHPFFFFSFCYWTLFLHPSTTQGIPQAVLPPLPKRPALEKTNGATAVFNTGIFQYQQALANMQLQQHTAFLPPGSILCMTPATSVVPMVHGATPATVSAATTSATSVPFAATATANQIPIISAEHLTSHKYVTQM